MKQVSDAIYIRLSMEEAVILNNLAQEAGTSPTNLAREILKVGLANEAGDFLFKVSPIEDILSRILDERLQKFANRMAGLSAKNLKAALDTRGYSINTLHQVLISRKLSEEEINKIMAIIKEAVDNSSKEKIKNNTKEKENCDV